MEKKENIRRRIRRHRAVKLAVKNYLQSHNVPNVSSLNEPGNEHRVVAASSCNADTSTESHTIVELDGKISNKVNNEECDSSADEYDGTNEFCEHIANHTCDDSSSSDDDLECKENDIRHMEDPEIQELRIWAIIHHIPDTHIDKLLLILRNRLLPKLPKTAKTFLKSADAQYDIKPMESLSGKEGKYVYLGISSGLSYCIDTNVHVDSMIRLQMNVDGSSPFRSGVKQLWPILCKVIYQPNIYQPFPVALYYGDSKPNSVEQYMTDFIEELNFLQMNGIHVNNKKYAVQLVNIICDTPARAFLKQVKGHCGYAACERCIVYGKSVTSSGNMKSRRIVYPDMNCPKRTNESFRNQEQREHHGGVSPLLKIEPPIDLIYTFPLDYMHLCCLGVMKKLYVMDMIFNNSRIKISPYVRKKLNKRMEFLSPFIPDEFQRKPRAIVPNLKASELRFLALYAGPIVFKDVLSEPLYQHFLLFHVAFRILCSSELRQRHSSLAKIYLRKFVSLLPKLFGEQSQVLNVHYLIHLSDDVQINNCTLNEISAFPFESYLGTLSEKLRSANKVLAQICRRIHAQRQVPVCPTLPPPFTILKQKMTANGTKMISQLQYCDFKLTTKSPNDMIMINDGTIVKITSITGTLDNEKNVLLTGVKWETKKPIFNFPTSSADLNMWELKDEPNHENIEVNLDEILYKIVKMCIKHEVNEGTDNSVHYKFFAIPLLH